MALWLMYPRKRGFSPALSGTMCCSEESIFLDFMGSLWRLVHLTVYVIVNNILSRKKKVYGSDP